MTCVYVDLIGLKALLTYLHTYIYIYLFFKWLFNSAPPLVFSLCQWLLLWRLRLLLCAVETTVLHSLSYCTRTCLSPHVNCNIVVFPRQGLNPQNRQRGVLLGWLFLADALMTPLQRRCVRVWFQEQTRRRLKSVCSVHRRISLESTFWF